MNEERISYLMKQLGISREDAIDLENYDADIERNKKTQYDLSAEQQKNVQEMNRHREHTIKNKVKRERKPNELKEAIIKEIFTFLNENAFNQDYEEVKIVNPNRMISFSIGQKQFELSLVEKRPPKQLKSQ